MPHGIYPQDLADDLTREAGKKWRPSNGTEGDLFQQSYCEGCTKDVNGDCPIIAATMAFDVDDASYPSEWRYGEDGQPMCSAFVAIPV